MITGEGRPLLVCLPRGQEEAGGFQWGNWPHDWSLLCSHPSGASICPVEKARTLSVCEAQAALLSPGACTVTGPSDQAHAAAPVRLPAPEPPHRPLSLIRIIAVA